MGKVDITASEAIYGFAAWLTSRLEPVTFSAAHDAAVVAELVDEYCKVNNLAEPRGFWLDNVRFPQNGDGGGPAGDIVLSDARIEAACRYMRENCSGDLKRDEVAELVHLSPGYFSNLFRAATGTYFTDYHVMVRIEKAKAMLRSFELSVTEVSKKCGFNNLAHFSRTFSRKVGVSPLKYRKNPRASMMGGCNARAQESQDSQ